MKYQVNPEDFINKVSKLSQIMTTEHLYAHFEYKTHIRFASKIAGALMGK